MSEFYEAPNEAIDDAFNAAITRRGNRYFRIRGDQDFHLEAEVVAAVREGAGRDAIRY